MTATDADCVVVGVGASAGGLGALEAFFGAISSEAGAGHAFIVVQHLAEDHQSLLPELLQRVAHLKVAPVVDDATVAPGHVYVMPAGVTVTVEEGRLKLHARTGSRATHTPIDELFRSLAQEMGPRAVGVVLSGSGRDGSAGVAAIKDAGGVTMAQEPTSAEFDAMPLSAIATHKVDYVLEPASMAYHLARRDRSVRAAPRARVPREDAVALDAILATLNARTGHDLSGYKRSTLYRRIERRMAVRSVDGLKGYAALLDRDETEAGALLEDVLIGVTRFFRDEECFDALRDEALPALFAALPEGDPLRVWVAGCSTGEEAYSLSILLQEWMDAHDHPTKLQIFATDLDASAIATARAGIYPESIEADVSAERLARFFSHNGETGAYRVSSRIREKVIFSEHDVLRDPPFSRIDLISCRNLLIYLDADSQQRLIPVFHYALNPGGALLLGPSETIGPFSHLFSTIDHRAKLFAQTPRRSAERPPLPQRGIRRGMSPARRRAQAPSTPKPSLREITERALLEHGHAVAMLVDRQGDVLFLHGRAGLYFEPAPGEGGRQNAFEMARDGLRHELAQAVHRVVEEGSAVRILDATVEVNQQRVGVELTVRRASLGAEPGDDDPILILLERRRLAPVEAAGAPLDDDEATGIIRGLRRELEAKDDFVRRSRLAAQQTQEALQSSNEELQSVNEELQSTNEELETSKEELQSVNEELATVNAELHANVTELTRANNDLSNLLAGTDIGTLFVDHALRIQRFTPAIRDIVPVIETDVGRPIGQITSNLAGYSTLIEDTRRVLETLVPSEVEVRSAAGSWYLLRIRPYRTLENVIEGAVITFTDITEMKRAREVIQESAATRRLAAVLRDAHDAVLVLAMDGRIEAWNPGAERLYGWTEQEALGMHIQSMITHERWESELTEILRASRSDVLEPILTKRTNKQGRLMDISLTATPLADTARGVYGISTTERRWRGSDDGGGS